MRKLLGHGRYANVTATLALIVAMSGTGYAAVTLANNSVGTAQLKANAVTSAKVKNGTLLKADFKSGQLPAGPAGSAGPAGATGPQGPAGPLVATLPSGKTLTGAYTVGGTAAATSAFATTSISFEIPLASAPTAYFVAVGSTAPVQCAGSAATPTAAPGSLCIYEGDFSNVGVHTFQDPVTGTTGGAIRPWGAEIFARSAAAGIFDSRGSWAVTAP